MTATPTFERDVAEDAIQSYLKMRIGFVSMFESTVDGVIAFERIDSYDMRRIDFDGMARHLSEAVGFPVMNIATADWSFDGRHDEEAHYVAFGVPTLDKDYADTGYRTELSEAYLEALEAEADAKASPAP